MPRGSEYTDEKRAAALILHLVMRAPHTEVEAKTGMKSDAVRKLASRAQQAHVDVTNMEALIQFARTKPRKGRPRRCNPESQVSLSVPHGTEVYGSHYPPDAANYYVEERQGLGIIDPDVQPFVRKHL